MKTSAEINYLIHTASILLIGLSSILYILDKPMQHETKQNIIDSIMYVLYYLILV